MDRAVVRSVVGLWLVWAVAVLSFQVVVVARFGPERPDTVLGWTASETGLRRHGSKPILQDQAWPGPTEWDSEFYLSIATAGYEDPLLRRHRAEATGRPISLNYAFMPLYPFAMRLVAAPLGALGLAPVAAASIAGVVVSVLAALFAMLALARLAFDQLGQDGSTRAAWYLALFPTGFFLAMVYTEALFLALAFGSLTQVADRRPLVAGILAALATLTRPVGVALAIPLVLGALAWWRGSRAAAVEPDGVPGGTEPGAVTAGTEPDGVPTSSEPSGAESDPPGSVAVVRRSGAMPFMAGAAWIAAIAFPLIAYAGWSNTMGADFDILQREFFGRAALDLDGTLTAWGELVDGLGTAEPRTVVYYALEAAAVVLAVVASAWALGRWPGLAIFGLVAILVPLTSGAPQSLIRYVLAVPAIFLLLASLGRWRVFDRGWALVSTLMMGLLLTLFTFDFWVA